MIREPALYFDGQTSARHRVELSLESRGILHIRGEGIERSLPLCDTRITPALADLHRSLYLEGGGKCELQDGPLARAIESRLKKGPGFRSIHRWENSLGLAATALGLTLLLAWLFFRFAIPLLAERVALAIPPAVETSLGTETLDLLDRTVFQPSALPQQRRGELHRLFEGMAPELGAYGARLEFRSAPAMGPNALALPSGIIVITDELVELAGDDLQISAVLAHEAGHLVGRHALRQMLQNSSAALLIATLSGDLGSIASFGAALPTLLINARYSRDMEREADMAAADFLKSRGHSIEILAGMFQKLEQWQRSRMAGGGQGAGMDYFSTHPAMKERIEMLRR